MTNYAYMSMKSINLNITQCTRLWSNTGFYVISGYEFLSVADLRRGREGRAPRVQIFSISCSFWENLANSHVGPPLGSWRPLLGEIRDLPLLVDLPS